MGTSSNLKLMNNGFADLIARLFRKPHVPVICWNCSRVGYVKRYPTKEGQFLILICRRCHKECSLSYSGALARPMRTI